MNVRPITTKHDKYLLTLSGQKNKPNSNTIKPNFKRRETNQISGKKKNVSGTFLRLWIAGKIDFLDGCDIIYLWEISI